MPKKTKTTKKTANQNPPADALADYTATCLDKVPQLKTADPAAVQALVTIVMRDFTEVARERTALGILNAIIATVNFEQIMNTPFDDATIEIIRDNPEGAVKNGIAKSGSGVKHFWELRMENYVAHEQATEH